MGNRQISGGLFAAVGSRPNSIESSNLKFSIPESFSFALIGCSVLSECSSVPVILQSIPVPNFASTMRWASVLTFIAVSTKCLSWGIPRARIGSWKSMKSNMHRIFGVLTLIVPLLFSLWEAFTSSHVPLPIYAFCILGIAINVLFGASLIPSRLPAYDIPTLRAFAVGCLLAVSFTSMSLFYRLGSNHSFTMLGIFFSLVSIFSTAYAWSDGLQHLNSYLKGNYKISIGKKWFLPFEKSTLKHVFLDCFWKQPTAAALDATVSPSNLVTACTTLLTAGFATISLLQLRYLQSGAVGMARMSALYPHIVRWSCYEALLAVVANNFGTFAGTLVLQNKVSQKTAGVFNALGLLIPVLNLAAFCFRYPEVISSLLVTSFGKLG